MSSDQDKTKQQKEHIEEAVENLAEKSSQHPPESKEVDQAKTDRALAEKELVDSRKR